MNEIDTNAKSTCEAELRDANACMAIGVGVGALGAGAAALAGAVCPLCIVIAPALVGAGALKRYRLKNKKGAVGEVTVLDGDQEVL